MIISHRRKFLYFVVPKCGSATIRHSLIEHTDIGYPVTKFTQHLPIRGFLETEYANLMGPYFKFTFVRNPYDRIYSGYIQDKFASENYGRWIKAKQPIFETIGDDFNRYMKEYVKVGDIKNDWSWISFCPMSEFSHYNNEYRLDWFGRCESLDEDLGKLAKLVGFDLEKADNINVRVKPSGELKYLDRYESSTVELVNRLYQTDFDFFGYSQLNPNDFPASITS